MTEVILLLGCDWLPDLLEYDDMYPNLIAYDNAVHNIFKKDFIDNHPIFLGAKVAIRQNPLVDGREQTYYHITSKDYDYTNNRNIDIRRCERIRWVKQIIEHYDCKIQTCFDCGGIKTWSYPHNKKQTRIKIFFAEERYIVILEKRPTYYLLITAYYVEYDHNVRKLLKEFEKAKSASAETQLGTPSTFR